MIEVVVSLVWAFAAGIYDFRRLPRVIIVLAVGFVELEVHGGTAASHYGGRRLQGGRFGEPWGLSDSPACCPVQRAGKEEMCFSATSRYDSDPNGPRQQAWRREPCGG